MSLHKWILLGLTLVPSGLFGQAAHEHHKAGSGAHAEAAPENPPPPGLAKSIK